MYTEKAKIILMIWFSRREESCDSIGWLCMGINPATADPFAYLRLDFHQILSLALSFTCSVHCHWIVIICKIVVILIFKGLHEDFARPVSCFSCCVSKQFSPPDRPSSSTRSWALLAIRIEPTNRRGSMNDRKSIVLGFQKRQRHTAGFPFLLVLVLKILFQLAL